MVPGFFFTFAPVKINSIFIMEDMRKYFLHYVAAFCGMVTLSSCAQEVINEDMSASDSRMTVMTRGEEDPVTSSVRLYVFDSNDECLTLETLDVGSSSFTKNLPAGTYDVYALAGDESRYALPSKDEATKTTPIALKSGEQLGDLMIGHSSVTLSDGNTNETTLNLSRKVILLRSVIIKDVPEGTTDVSVKISPIQESILLNGTYQGDEGVFSVALTKQSDGTTWKMATEDVFLLPSVGKPTITITIGTTSFPYSCPNELEANHKITIEGTYKEPTTQPAELTLTGTINGVAWGEDSHVSFDFGPADEDNGPSGEIPAEGSTYLGCYVLKVNGNEVTLLSPSQELRPVSTTDSQNDMTTTINGKLSSWERAVSDNWRLPNNNDAEAIASNYNDLKSRNDIGSPFSNSYNYLLTYENEIRTFRLNQQGNLNIVEVSSTTAAICLRPVTTITIQ